MVKKNTTVIEDLRVMIQTLLEKAHNFQESARTIETEIAVLEQKNETAYDDHKKLLKRGELEQANERITSIKPTKSRISELRKELVGVEPMIEELLQECESLRADGVQHRQACEQARKTAESDERDAKIIDNQIINQRSAIEALRKLIR